MPDFEGKPFRKKGYHRALRRGAAWAVKLSKKKGFDFLLSFGYRNTDWSSLLFKDNWLLKNVEKDDAWRGGTYVVPFDKYKKDDK